MSLENEYFTWKQMRENAQRHINKMESLDVENMTQEQLEARERVIKMSKEQIEEAEEILEKIKEELIEFVNNGGEVSEITLKELNLDNDDTVDFKVQHKKSDVCIEGYVYVNEIDDEAPLHFFDRNGNDVQYVPSNPYSESHSYDSYVDYEIIKNEFQSDDLFLQFLFDCKDENRTFDRGEYLLIINEG